MTSDIYVQQNAQSSSGAVTRKWLYNQTVSCKIMPVQNKSGRSITDDKNYTSGIDGYNEDVHLKMQSPIRLSKRWRVSNIVASNGERVYIEMDKYGQDDTYFEVMSSHPVLDPFGNISYYEVNLRRVQVQENDLPRV